MILAGTADPVKDYLKQIGRVNLLNAEQEVDPVRTHRGRSVPNICWTRNPTRWISSAGVN